MTVHYAFTAFLILSFSISMLYWGLATSLRSQSVHYLNAEVELVEGLMKSGELTAALKKEIEFSHQSEYIKLYLRILDRDGHPLIETPDMSEDLPAELFPPPQRQGSAKVLPYKSSDNGRNSYLIKVLWLQLEGPPRYLQLALDVTNMDQLLQDYRIKLASVLFIGIILSAIAASYISRKGLQPLHEITEKTMHITSSNLDERFVADDWPKELNSLAVAFDEMLDRLQQSFERLKQYSANLAHELRTPIGNLMGEAEIALSMDRTSVEYRDVIESSLEEYQKLSRTIDSLYFLAWANSGNVHLNVTQIRIFEELSNLLDYFGAFSSNIQIEVHCTPGVVLMADATLFRRAVSNLITNAIKYSPDGAKIMITVQDAPTAGVEIVVSDNGIGIGAEHIEHLFDRFYRVPTSSDSLVKGLGLGLPIVKSIMDLHGGTISIISLPSQGTTVTLTFPPSSVDQSN